jgi:hypothetical protein
MKKKILFILLLSAFFMCGVASAGWDDGGWSETKVPYTEQTSNPTVNDYNYQAPYVWVNTTTNKYYMLIDNTPGAAVWQRIVGYGLSGLTAGNIPKEGANGLTDSALSDDGTSVTVTHATQPVVKIYNTTQENTDGGRESRIIGRGEKGDGTVGDLAEIEIGHDGTGNDLKGYIDFNINDGNDADGSLTNWFRFRADGSMELNDGTGTGILKVVNEPGLGSRITWGLPEAARTMVICDAGDVGTDFGLAVQTEPSLIIMKEDGTLDYTRIRYNGFLRSGGLVVESGATQLYKFNIDRASGDAYIFSTDANIELTDTDGKQAWLKVDGKVNQQLTASYNLIEGVMTETAIGDGSTGTGATNNLIVLGTAAYPDMFKVDNVGSISNSGILKPSTVNVTCEDTGDTCAYSATITQHWITAGTDATGDTMTVGAGAEGDTHTFTLVGGTDDVVIDVSTGTDTTLTGASGDSVTYRYDSNASTWRIIAGFGI